MKRFFSFVLLVLLLLIAVGSLRQWHDRRTGLFSFPGSLSELFGNGETGHRRPEKYTLADGPRVKVGDVDVLAAMSQQRVTLAKAVVPSVVSIITSKTVQSPSYLNDPLFKFFHRGRMHGSPKAPTNYVLGSGVIVSKEGHIVTNNHVIDQMDDIEVELNDGRRERATLIGADSDIDVAVLKINAGELTPLPFGDSDKVQVGETIMAIGNPYGYEESVTQGIISAKGRSGSDTLSDLFQIDAAINPGNSGGPLINVQGELIGLNEGIYSESGGWQGMGFAIPSDTVRRTMDSILKTGRMIYGYLGVLAAPRMDMQAGPGEPAERQGALVYDVVAGSPAEKAQIQAGDLIQKFNNRDVRNFQDLRRDVAQVDINAAVPIELVRDGKTMTVTARVGEKPSQGQLAGVLPGKQQPGDLGEPAAPGKGSFGGSRFAKGVAVSELTPQMSQMLNLPPDEKGVLITRVDPDSIAAAALEVGDVIEQVGPEPIGSLGDFEKALRQLPGSGPLTLSVVRKQTHMMVALNPG